jgi:flavin reductase (DIM6/NTAB) family NADH-FMN oxidoreductase RutF
MAKMIDRQQFKDVMARIPSAVAVITSRSQSGLHGVTVSSFGSLSLDPPLAYLSILREINSHDRLLNTDGFVINVLARKQTFYAEQFSGQTPLADPDFDRIPHRLGELGLPLIDGCISWIECRHSVQHPAGDHTLFIGDIINLQTGDSDDPLIYYDREFLELSW